MNNFISSGSISLYIHLFSFIVLTYCIFRIFFHRLLTFFVNEHEFFADPKYKELVKVLVYSGISPWPHWDEDQRRNWDSRWWIYGIIGLVSFLIVSYTLYLSTL